MMKLNLFGAISLSIIVFTACKTTEVDNSSTNTTTTYKGTGSVTQGIGKTTISSLYSCSGGRVTAVGTITSTDGKVWTLPAETDFLTGTKLPDLYNECTGVKPSSISQVDVSKIPTIIIDADGEVITGYIHGDNYYELYVNGKLGAVDAVPYTPFNSSVVKFKAKRPIKYAVKLVDWEENLGMGSEANGNDAYHPGDGGFIAKFSDGTSTSSAWKAQTFYTAPLADINCVTETGTSRISSSCSNNPTSGAKSYALHWEIPSTWFASDYDFSKWPSATTFTEAQVGVKPAYSNFTSSFSGSQFIWSSNLILDNLVVLRSTGN
jgi:hypothetical protein